MNHEYARQQRILQTQRRRFGYDPGEARDDHGRWTDGGGGDGGGGDGGGGDGGGGDARAQAYEQHQQYLARDNHVRSGFVDSLRSIGVPNHQIRIHTDTDGHSFLLRKGSMSRDDTETVLGKARRAGIRVADHADGYALSVPRAKR